ncbi:PLDc N-terminal domain-containing protein [Lacihabitans soyangensis]|uniref:PLDc_N domain-containing protein n=1 Tax=Lacihabitans soyangensis TaxID=869394 RepID=A0AAE3KT92_9BACT|nr:PLDc N-terminal domain-containing protein [Lacihabitans soyangensis]MCP9763868.1 PLDc_N domain-containing protein [Lacihabitans soyangensis]
MTYLSLSFGLVFWQIMVFSFWLLMIFAIIDIVRSKFEGNHKLIWVLVTIFVPFGGLIYFIFGRKNKLKE